MCCVNTLLTGHYFCPYVRVLSIIHMIINFIGCRVYRSLQRFLRLVGRHAFTNTNKYLIMYLAENIYIYIYIF
jgi:hypothetical protein